jgi:CheY-like chemotaxis protein
MEKVLVGQGHKVTAVGTVHAVLEADTGTTFDLVISDLGLPDGYEVIRGLWKQFAARGVPIRESQ